MEGGGDGGGVVDERAFSDFEAELVAVVGVGGVQEMGEVGQEVGVGELAGGDVDGDVRWGDEGRSGRPGGGGVARGVQGPTAEGCDQPGVFGEGDEDVGEQEAAGRVLPADEGFGADGVAGGVEDGLVMEAEFAGGGQGVAEVVFGGEAVEEAGAHGFVEQEVMAAA